MAIEDKFSVIFYHSPVAMALADSAEFKTIDVNPAFEQLYGYSRSEVIGRTSADLQLYENMAQREETILKIKADGSIRDMELTIRRKDGQLRDILVSIEQIEFEGRLCSLAVSQDISDRKKAENALRESEERFSTAFRLNTNALVISRIEDGRIIEVNETFLKLFGYTRDEVIGNTSVGLEMFANSSDRKKAVKRLQDEGFLHDFELTVKTKTAEERIVLLSAELLKTRSEQTFLTIIRDITDSKLQELALLESEKKFRDLAESMPQIVWTARADGSVDYYSKQVDDLEGIHITDGDIWEWAPVIHDDDIEFTLKTWHNAINTGTLFEVVHRIRKKDGTYKWFLSRAIPIKNENGSVTKWYGTSTDISLQKAAEEEILNSQSKLNQAQALAHLGSWELDLQKNKLTWSDEVYRIFGYQPQEFGATYEAFLEAVHPDDRAAVNNAYTGSVTEGKDGYEIEHRIIRKSTGELRIVHEKCHHFRSPAGEIIRSIGMVHDITESKKAEEELKEQERRFRTLAENSPEVIARFDRDLRHTYINKYGAAVYGIPLEEIIGKTNAELGMPAEKVEFWKQNFNEVFESGKQRTVEFDFEGPNFGLQHFSSLFVPEFNEEGQVFSILAITRDITERKLLEEKLLKSEQSVRHKLNSILSPGGNIGELELSDIIESDTIQIMMDNFYKIAKIPMSIIDLKGNVLVGIGWQKICTDFHRLHPETHQYCLESDLQLSQGVLPGEFKLYKCKNNMWDISSPIMVGGKHLGNLFIGQFYFDNEKLDYDFFREQARKYGFNEEEYIAALEVVPRISGEVLSAGMEFFVRLSNMISMLSFRNVELARLLAERESLTNSLRQTQEELKRSNRELEQFAYTASHDLQEPIRMIKSYAQLIQLVSKEKPERNTGEYLNFISQGASRMQQLVDDLLTYSRITTANRKVEAVDCNIVLKNVLDDLKFRIEEEDAHITYSRLPVVKGSESQLRQLFQNLLQNAVKFRSEQRPEINISCERKNSHWLFSVRDNGIGIEKIYHERIFIIFQRLHERDKYPGTGIGLALCKKIVERHGGEIYLESEPGRGTAFHFTLPAD